MEFDDPETIAYMETIRDRVIIHRYSGPFNYARMNNDAVYTYLEDNNSLPPYLLFLNNDIEAIESGWLEHMRGLAARPDVGVVGATLLYANDTIQHAGVVIGLNGVADHAHKFIPFRAPTVNATPAMPKHSFPHATTLRLRRRAS